MTLDDRMFWTAGYLDGLKDVDLNSVSLDALRAVADAAQTLANKAACLIADATA